jgi:SAM-dependent methyltransferase
MTVKVVIDRKQMRANQRRAREIESPDADFLYRHVLDDLFLRLSAVNRRFDDTVVIVPEAAGDPETWPETVRRDAVVRHPGEEGEVPSLAAGRYDLAVDLLTLHETNDTPGVLAQIRRALKPDGLFIGCLPGGQTLHELRTSLLSAEAELSGAAHARVLPFMEVRDAGGLLQRAGFALPVADRETITVRYETMFHLMRDLRAMGATNSLHTRNRHFSPRTLFARAAEFYADEFADPDGRIRATFEFIWISGWAPHESQQKPLKPGSAVSRLSDVLGDKSGG